MPENSEISGMAMFAKIPEAIYILVISLTMLSVDGKLFWLLNMICSILKLCLVGLYYFIGVQDNKPVSTLIAMDLVLAFTFCFETFLQAFDTFYIPSAAGKIIANICGIGFIVAYLVLLNFAVENSDENKVQPEGPKKIHREVIINNYGANT